MNPLPETAAPGVVEKAAAVADQAAELYDLTAGTPSWSKDAAEDAIEVAETVLIALQSSHPDAALYIMPTGYNLKELRRLLGLPLGSEEEIPGEEPAPVEVPVPRRARPRRRGLGPGGCRHLSGTTSGGK
ncbi:hypothetical protein J7E93_07425 [Streptomyces sp. ISL-36]|uniref:hypothetical protein n=1 Tax=Streptomyces sp. ISL-36 TaxID=2819182 RepID=UPI001BE77CD3|nr:hypothetical protein [Streptomyces sp. ISL-36]MBT2439953.1 hypothetical protein [Streptomyces sp. ISL-36]